MQTCGKFEEINGNLFNNITSNQIIVHCCNVCGGWGAGFVLPLAKVYPYSREYYLKVHNTIGLILGTSQIIEVDKTNRIYVSNMISQTLGGKRPLFYNHLSRCMDTVANYIENSDVKLEIICPRFGSALAGGNWEFIKELIMDCWIKKGLTVKVFYL